jgi:hypothetical protein
MEFTAFAYGPGTMARDFAWFARLRSAREDAFFIRIRAKYNRRIEAFITRPGVAEYEFHLAAKRSHFDVHGESTVRPARDALTGDQSMAFRPRDIAEHDQPVETDAEEEIREFVRCDVMAKPGPQPESESHMVASNINAALQGATATSVQEIEKLIGELQALRDMLRAEATRVQREIVQYSTLTQAALQSTKTIAESLEQWRKAPYARAVRLTVGAVRQPSGRVTTRD